MAGLNRRAFLSGSAVLAAAGAAKRVAAMLPGEQRAYDAYNAFTPPVPKDALASEPVLQVPACDSMGVSFLTGCGGFANGFAEVADNPEMKGAVRFFTEGLPQGAIDDKVLKVRMTGLKPATRYWYRVGVAAINDVKGSWRKPSEIVWGTMHTFTTAGEKAESAFAVMNDTHGNAEGFARVTKKIASLNVPVQIWNGDCMRNSAEKIEYFPPIYLTPPNADGYAADIPVVLNRGNHDYRGLVARYLDNVMLTRLHTERNVRDQPLTRNFAYRQGDIALIGLETGEDKPDRHPANGGYGRFEAFRTAQTAWLEDQFKRPEIAQAPFVVVFVHIPLFDPDPKANPGTTMIDYAHWQAQCAAEWGPVLTKNKVQVVVAGHMHRYRYDAPTANRPWAQIVGGGPQLKDVNFPTVIEGRVKGGKLVITAHNVLTDTVLDTFTYEKRV